MRNKIIALPPTVVHRRTSGSNSSRATAGERRSRSSRAWLQNGAGVTLGDWKYNSCNFFVYLFEKQNYSLTSNSSRRRTSGSNSSRRRTSGSNSSRATAGERVAEPSFKTGQGLLWGTGSTTHVIFLSTCLRNKIIALPPTVVADAPPAPTVVADAPPAPTVVVPQLGNA